jgi:hypothetical protein
VQRVAHIGGDQDLVAGADPDGTQRQLQAGAARADRDRRLGAEPDSQLALERGHLGTGRHPAATDDRRHPLGVRLVEARARVRDQRFSSSRTD